MAWSAELNSISLCTGMAVAVAVSEVAGGSSVRMLPRVCFGGCVICWLLVVGDGWRCTFFWSCVGGMIGWHVLWADV
jgi:hypothetical protein